MQAEYARFCKAVGLQMCIRDRLDTLPPEMKATVEEMIRDGSATYSGIVTYLEQQGYSLSVSSVCRYAQGYVENLQTLQIAQANFRNMLDTERLYPCCSR